MAHTSPTASPAGAAPAPPPTHPAATAVAAGGGVAALLTRLTVALNRRRAYAADHPMVRQAEENALAELRAATAGGRTLTIAVAHHELLVDGAPVEQGAAVARELAERLHRRGVGALSFDARLTADGLRTGLAWLAAGGPLERPDSATPAPTVEGLGIGRVAYDRLMLGDEAEDARLAADALWRALAAAAFELELPEEAFHAGAGATSGGGASGGAGDGGTSGGRATGERATGGADTNGAADDGVTHDGVTHDAATTAGIPADGEAPTDGLAVDPSAKAALDDLAARSPDDVAAAIDRRAQHEPYAKQVAFALLALANQVAAAPPGLRDTLAERLRAVLHRLERSSIAKIIGAIGTGREQRAFLGAVINALPAVAVIEWLEVTASATDQHLSHHLLRILAKLSKLAGRRQRAVMAQDALRSAARALVDGWVLDDPNPVAHTSLLDRIALADASGDDRPSRHRGPSAPASVQRAAAAFGAFEGGGPRRASPPDGRGGGAVAPGALAEAAQRAEAAGAGTADGTSADSTQAGDQAAREAAEDAPHDGGATSTAGAAPTTGVPPVAPPSATAPSAVPSRALALATLDELPPELAEHTRLVQMACETDVAAADAVGAAEVLVRAGFSITLLAWLDRAPGAAAATTLRDVVTAPGAIRAVLLREPFDGDEARALLPTLPAAALPVLFDVLAESPNRSARRLLFDHLRAAGDTVLPEIARRLTGEQPWYVTRNTLALLREVGGLSEDARATEALRPLAVLAFLDHQREQVRLEALRLLVDDDATRDPAIRRALDDAHASVVAFAVDAAAAHATVATSPAFSRALAVRLMQLVDRGTLDAERAARAVRALAAASAPTVRDWLLQLVTRRTKLLRRRALAEATPAVVAALELLALQYGNDAEVPPVLELAMATRDGRALAVRAGMRRAMLGTGATSTAGARP